MRIAILSINMYKNIYKTQKVGNTNDSRPFTIIAYSPAESKNELRQSLLFRLYKDRKKKMPNIGFVAKIKNDVSQGFLGNVTL